MYFCRWCFFVVRVLSLHVPLPLPCTAQSCHIFSSFPWHIGTGVRCAITSDLSWYADISSARNCWLAIHRSEASIHTRDESSTVHANCMTSTSLRSFSCSDWILSFVVFVLSCRFHHQKQKTPKKFEKKKPRKKKSGLVSRSLLSLQFALLLLLVVCFRVCLCAFAHHEKKKPSQKNLKTKNPEKKVHFCVLVIVLVLVVCSCCSRPRLRLRHAFLLFSFLFSSCVCAVLDLVMRSCCSHSWSRHVFYCSRSCSRRAFVSFSSSSCLLVVALVLCSRSAFVLCVLAVVFNCCLRSAFMSCFRLSHVTLEVTLHVLLSLFSLRAFAHQEKKKKRWKETKPKKKKVLIRRSQSAFLSCFRLLHVALDARLLISFFSCLLHTTKRKTKKKKKLKRKNLKKQSSLACLFCSFVTVAHASTLFRSVLFGFWFLSEFWVSVLYLHSMYPINCLVYRGAWGGSYAWQRSSSLVSSVALFSWRREGWGAYRRDITGMSEPRHMILSGVYRIGYHHEHVYSKSPRREQIS